MSGCRPAPNLVPLSGLEVRSASTKSTRLPGCMEKRVPVADPSPLYGVGGALCIGIHAPFFSTGRFSDMAR